MIDYIFESELLGRMPWTIKAKIRDLQGYKQGNGQYEPTLVRSLTSRLSDISGRNSGEPANAEIGNVSEYRRLFGVIVTSSTSGGEPAR